MQPEKEQVQENEPPADAPAATTGSDLVHGGLWTAVGALVGLPVTTLSNVAIARALGADELGHYGQIVMIWSIAGLLVNSGVSAASVQWLSLARGRRSTEEFFRAIRVCAGYHFFFQAPVLALLAVLLARGTWVWLAILVGCSTLVEQVTGTASVVLSGANRNARAAQIGIATNLIRTIVVVGASLAGASAVAIWALALPVGMLAMAACFAQLNSAERHALLSFRGSLPWPAGFRRYSVNVGLISLATTVVFGRSELLVLGAHHLQRAAGLFVVATGVASLASVPMDSLMGPLHPAAAFYTGQSRERAAEMLGRALRITGVLGGLSATAIPLIGVIVPVLYGSQYREAVVAAQVVTCVALLRSVLNPLSAFTISAGRTGSLLGLTVTSAAVDVLVAVTFIPAWGLNGALAATMAAQMSYLVGSVVVAARVTGLSLRTITWSIGPLAIGVVCGAVGSLATGHIFITLVAALGGLVAYRLAVTAIPHMGVNEGDWERLLKALGARTRLIGRAMQVLIGSSPDPLAQHVGERR